MKNLNILCYFTKLIFGVLGAFILNTASASGSTAVPPRPMAFAPSARKLAVIGTNKADAGFNAASASLMSGLRDKGWIVYEIGQDEADNVLNGPTPAQVLRREANKARKGDQVLIVLNGHGLPGSRPFTSIESGGRTVNFRANYIDALSFTTQSTTLLYPTEDAVVWEAHDADAGFPVGSPNMSSGISAKDMVELGRSLRLRGVAVTIIDQSCEGGSTVKLSQLRDPGLCAISSAGQLSPSLVGVPDLGRGVANVRTFSDLARFITSEYQQNSHPLGTRIFSIGYTNSCAETMPLREIADAAANSPGTWWDWTRRRRLHVLREPQRYSTVAEADPTFLYVGPSANPRLRVPLGEQRWFASLLEDFRNRHQIEGRFDSAQTEIVYNEGVSFMGLITQYQTANDLLEDLLSQSAPPAVIFPNPTRQNSTVDEQLRSTFINRCLCQSAEIVSRFHLTCSAVVAPSNSDWNLYSPTSWCNRPRDYVANVLNGYPAIRDQLMRVETLNRQITAGLAAFSKVLVPYESTCESASCSGQII